MVKKTMFKRGFQIAVITLNNPSKLNALTEPMGDALIARVEEVKKMPEVRAAVITGDLKSLKYVKKLGTLTRSWKSFQCWR